MQGLFSGVHKESRFVRAIGGHAKRLYVLLPLCVFVLLFAVPAQSQNTYPASQAMENRIQRVLTDVSPAIVRVWEDKEHFISGVLISHDGLVATCAHIAAKVGGETDISLADGRRVPGRVLSKLAQEGESRTGKDIALVQISIPGILPAVRVAESANVTTQDWVLGIGYPDTLLYGQEAATRPRYVRLGHPISTPYQAHSTTLTTSLFGTGGDSGGPLFDLAGNLIGIVSSGDASGAHMTYTRIDVLRRDWKQLAGNRHAPPVTRTLPGRIPALLQKTSGAKRSLASAVVEVRSNDRWIGLGCVVGPGWVLTKASELGPNLTLVFENNYVAVAKVIATDPACDLALLNVPADELTRNVFPAFQRVSPVAPSPGALLTAVTPAEFTSPTGIVCFDARPVPRMPGVLPYGTRAASVGVEVTEVWEDQTQVFLRPPVYPLQVGDIITHVEGKPILSREAYVKMVFEEESIGAHPRVFGEPINVTYQRAGQSYTKPIVLIAASTPSVQRVHPFSYRYTSFPSAIATDLPVRPEHCGAPVMDSRGRVIGILIARAPFIESLVLPAREVMMSLTKMNEQVQMNQK